MGNRGPIWNRVAVTLRQGIAGHCVQEKEKDRKGSDVELMQTQDAGDESTKKVVPQVIAMVHLMGIWHTLFIVLCDEVFFLNTQYINISKGMQLMCQFIYLFKMYTVKKRTKTSDRLLGERPFI